MYKKKKRETQSGKGIICLRLHCVHCELLFTLCLLRKNRKRRHTKGELIKYVERERERERA